MKILVKYTSRSRPGPFLEGLKSITNLSADKNLYTVLITLDEDDPTMNNDEVRNMINQHPNTLFIYGKSESKIHAINRDLEQVSDWDILVNFSDDMRFIAHGWDTLIRDGFRINAPDLDGWLHYPDSTAKNMLATMSIIGRKYFERDGYIYHPSYLSLWSDNEEMLKAQKRGKYHYMGIQIYDHLHPAYGLSEWDIQYKIQQNYWGVDEENFKKRAARNFDLKPEEIVNEVINPYSDYKGA